MEYLGPTCILVFLFCNFKKINITIWRFKVWTDSVAPALNSLFFVNKVYETIFLTENKWNIFFVEHPIQEETFFISVIRITIFRPIIFTEMWFPFLNLDANFHQIVFILCKNEMLICCYKLDHLKFALFIKSTWHQFDKLCDQKYCVYIQIIENEREKYKTTNEPVEIAKRWKHLFNNSKIQLNKIQFSY